VVISNVRSAIEWKTPRRILLNSYPTLRLRNNLNEPSGVKINHAILAVPRAVKVATTVASASPPVLHSPCALKRRNRSNLHRENNVRENCDRTLVELSQRARRRCCNHFQNHHVFLTAVAFGGRGIQGTA
jgi:hypothetical protein